MKLRIRILKITILILLMVFSLNLSKKNNHKKHKSTTKIEDKDILIQKFSLNQIAQSLTYDSSKNTLVENTDKIKVQVFDGKIQEPIEINDIKAIAGISHLDKDTVIISFRGTINLCNIKKDLDVNGTNITNNKNQGCSDCHVHSGFYDSYKKIRDKIRKLVTDFITNNSILRFIITGHSLGGAMAVLCAYDMVDYYNTQNNNPNAKFFLVTFGSPRVGDQKLADHMTGLLGKGLVRNVRVTFGKDSFPKIPSEVKGISYVHSGTQIQYDNPKEYTIKTINKDETERMLESGFVATVLKNVQNVPTTEFFMCNRFLNNVTSAIFGLGRKILDKIIKKSLRKKTKRLRRKEKEQLFEPITDHLRYVRISDKSLVSAFNELEGKLNR